MPVKSKLKVKSEKLKVAEKKPAVKQSKSEVVSKKTASSVKSVSKVEKAGTRFNLSIPVYSLSGRASGTLALPKEIFAARVNNNLLAQAMRVYLTNTKSLTGSTKTRGEVEGSTAKIYRQKGTGRARHGAIRAPIFVGGGITFGPKPRKVRLDLPKKMKKAALLSALSSKLLDKSIVGLSGIEKISGKTKEMAQLLTQLNSKFKIQKSKMLSALIVTPEKMDNVARGVSNIPGVDVLPVNLINAYEVLKHEMLVLTKEAVSVILGTYRDGTSLARMTIKRGKQ